MENVTAKRILAAVNAAFGKGTATTLADGGECEVSEVIPTGISVVDHYVTGIGGLPVGRLVELYSEEGGGKSTLALTACASCQREGGVAVWAESEEALQREWAAKLGVCLDDLVLLQPGSIEDTGKQAEAVLQAHAARPQEPLLFVWDSIAATRTQREVDEGLQGDARVGERARQLSAICRQLCALAPAARATLLFINQTREKIGVMFGDKYTTPGGHAVKFHASLRLQLFGGKALKAAGGMGEHLGKAVTVLAAKNKLAPPWRKAQARLLYEGRWDDAWSTVNHAKARKLVQETARMSADLHAESRRALGWPTLDEHAIDVPVEAEAAEEGEE